MNSLQQILNKNKAPQGDVAGMSQYFIAETERRIEEIVNKAKEDISKMAQDSLFKDLVKDVRERAQKEADSIVSEFKSQLIKTNLSSEKMLEDAGKEIVSDIKDKILKIGKQHSQSFDDKISLIEKKGQEIVKMINDKADELKGEDGDDADEEAIYRRLVKEIPPAIPGLPGTPGANGSPDTGEEIAGKLNTTKESVDRSVIKGLNTLIKNLQTSIRELSRNKNEKGGGATGGGGMGNVIHEQTSTSASTTTVITANKVAANGLALWAHYNGQSIQLGTHFTIRADRKGINLLITPEDSTTITIIYIRA